MQLAMGNVQNQLAVLEAVKNTKELWKKIFEVTNEVDDTAPLEAEEEKTSDFKKQKTKKFKPKKDSLWDPYSPIVTLLTYIYQ